MLEAIRLVHSMVGTAGSFGHHQISDTLRVVERVLRAAVDKPGDLLEEHWEMLYIAVDQLNQIHQLENPETVEIELELNIHS
jgi:chemotaxis protein histidine kinase CheA